MSSVLATPAAAPARLLAAIVDLPTELHRRQPHLAAAALLSLIAIVPCLLAMQFDIRMVNDINVWIKPTKFFASLALYFATLAWVFGYLPRSAQASVAGRIVIVAALVAGLAEMVWLVLAAASGVPAHFNRASPVWSLAYSTAGAVAVVLIAVILVQGLMVARQRDGSVAPALRTAIVLGAVIAFVATLLTAGVLASGSGHWVGGIESDAAGLPLLGWSRTGGDLRVAHFWALHAQQFVPLAGLLLVAIGRPHARVVVVVAAIGYVALIAFTFVQALRGHPFLPMLG